LTFPRFLPVGYAALGAEFGHHIDRAVIAPRRGLDRPRASGGREALARRHFPYRDQTPAEYAEAHAADMIGFTYDEESYADPDLDAWVVELGRILRERRDGAETEVEVDG